MPVDLHVARPFLFNAADGNRYELPIAVLPGMSDAFAADFWVVAHTEAAVLARGGRLFQWREVQQLGAGNLPPYQPAGWFAMMFLEPVPAPQ